MQTIAVLIAAEPSNVHPGKKQSVGLIIARTEEKSDVSRLTKAKDSTPPFWTWFIENPRTRFAY
jgi:hypothetical protein